MISTKFASQPLTVRDLPREGHSPIMAQVDQRCDEELSAREVNANQAILRIKFHVN